DVEKAAKELNYDFSGVDAAKNEKGLYGIRYSDFVVPLVKAVQELSKMNDKKDALIEDLQKQVNELRSVLSIADKPVNTKDVLLTNASVKQNVPNPFSGTTTIDYTLPKTYSSA